MRTIPIFLIALLGIPHHTMAAGDDYYWSLKTSFGASSIDEISHHGTIGTGQRIGRDIDGLIRDTRVSDYTAGLGFAVGKRLNHWQVETEVTWRYRTDWDVFAPTPSIGTITNMFANVSTTSVLLNLSRRGAISQRWSWETGAGVGWVLSTIDAEYKERIIPGVAPERRFTATNREDDFAFTVFGGLVRETKGAWKFNTQLRLIDLGELSAGPFPGRAARLSARHRAITLTFGIERNL
jgi:hypothetical protein